MVYILAVWPGIENGYLNRHGEFASDINIELLLLDPINLKLRQEVFLLLVRDKFILCM
jgi:hypothetical protein